MTGADVYYWFIGGFGDFERLHSSHLAPIDIPIMASIISLTVQMYFCFRVWTLTKNMWLCAAITTVCVSDPPRVSQALDFP